MFRLQDMELTNPLAAQAVQADKARRQAELTGPEPGKPNRDRGNRSVQDITVQTITQFQPDGGGLETSKESSPPSYASVSRASSCKSTKESTPADTSRSLSRSASCSIKDTAGVPNTVSFSSGNPFVEVTRGILHLYKENQTTSLDEGVLRSQMLCKYGFNSENKIG